MIIENYFPQYFKYPVEDNILLGECDLSNIIFNTKSNDKTMKILKCYSL